jgi:hypothetical protein
MASAFVMPITMPSSSCGIAPQPAARGIASQTTFTSRHRPPTHMGTAAPLSPPWIGRALIPIVGVATSPSSTSNSQLCFLVVLLKDTDHEETQKHTHTHVQGRAPKALQQGILPCNTSATLFQLALTATFSLTGCKVFIQVLARMPCKPTHYSTN